MKEEGTFYEYYAKIYDIVNSSFILGETYIDAINIQNILILYSLPKRLFSFFIFYIFYKITLLEDDEALDM